MRSLILLTSAALGCSGGGDANRFIPPPKTARAALTAALEAWKQGAPTGLIAGSAPAIHVLDETRPAGQRLACFEILAEVPGDGPRTFTVALEVGEPPTRQTARYVVVGVDPLWVFRQEDFDKMAHWEMNMHEGEPTQKTTDATSDAKR